MKTPEGHSSFASSIHHGLYNSYYHLKSKVLPYWPSACDSISNMKNGTINCLILDHSAVVTSNSADAFPSTPMTTVFILKRQNRTTRRLLTMDHVILNHGQVMWTAPELASPLLTTTLHQRKDVSALDRFNVLRCPTQRVFSGTGLKLVTRQATVRYLYHSATAAIVYIWER
ncbi:uncharacterized protein TNCV_194941 [Trichonephila clavipes]|uniref:Uncharacterized protein n=1 Tax=Trichonephila clavipes TaxID=2585209 RepID=A0A8X7BKL2_TRICX|nr:uncharacterized protein TNCV_194941 [Trichonephila clavipes]